MPIRKTKRKTKRKIRKTKKTSKLSSNITTQKGGGYNVNRYYLSRLNRYDKELFSGYSVKERKSNKNTTGTQKSTYATRCAANYDRQPIVVTKDELDRINSTDEGEGVSFSKAINIPDRNPYIYYICPKYWDVKENRPRDPKRVNEFKEHIIDNKMSAHQKKVQDNYILERNHAYWRNAGNDINKYSIRTTDNFHPKGYKVPCCGLKQALLPKPGWRVEVRINEKKPNEWTSAVVKSVEPPSQVTVITQGRKAQEIRIDISNIRLYKGDITPPSVSVIIDKATNTILTKHFDGDISTIKVSILLTLMKESKLSKQHFLFLKKIKQLHNKNKRGEIILNITYS